MRTARDAIFLLILLSCLMQSNRSAAQTTDSTLREFNRINNSFVRSRSPEDSLRAAIDSLSQAVEAGSRLAPALLQQKRELVLQGAKIHRQTDSLLRYLLQLYPPPGRDEASINDQSHRAGNAVIRSGQAALLQANWSEFSRLAHLCSRSAAGSRQVDRLLGTIKDISPGGHPERGFFTDMPYFAVCVSLSMINSRVDDVLLLVLEELAVTN